METAPLAIVAVAAAVIAVGYMIKRLSDRYSSGSSNKTGDDVPVTPVTPPDGGPDRDPVEIDEPVVDRPADGPEEYHLPDDFPARSWLEKSDTTTWPDLTSYDNFEDIPYIGEGRAQDIREYMAANNFPQEEALPSEEQFSANE